MAYVLAHPTDALAFNPSAEYFVIPWGHAGIESTIRHMRRIAKRGAAQPLLRESAASIVGDAGSSFEAASAIRRFLERRTEFVFDPVGVELIRSPVYMLRAIQARGTAVGDCDDVAVLGAALGLAAGIPARFVLLGFTEAEPFEHVYTELLSDGGAVELDTTRPAQMPADIEILQVGYRRV